MNAYVQIFDELPQNKNIKYTFTGRNDSFFIYVFFKNDEKSPLELLNKINLIANKLGVCEFWMKKSVISDENTQIDYEDNKYFKYVYAYRAVDLEKNNVKFA